MRVLLCDDHRLLAEVLLAALTARGDEVVLTTSPAQALEHLRRHAVDVCVMDLHFPDGDGVDATRDLLGVAPSLRVLLLTGAPSGPVARRALDAGARGLLGKQQPLAAVLEAVDSVHGGALAVDPLVLRPGVPRRDRSPLDALTPREREVLGRLRDGESTRVMARGMGVADSTARTHTEHVLGKLGVSSRLQASAVAASYAGSAG